MTTHQHTASGRQNETVAVLDDGRVVTINTQYGAVLPHGKHADDCDQINKMGGRCNCGLLAGIDVAALVADARVNGKLGAAPVAQIAPETIPASRNMEVDAKPWDNPLNAWRWTRDGLVRG